MATYLANPALHAVDIVARVIEPPPAIDFLDWAKSNIVFSKRESAFPGPYNPDLFPFFSEILKAFSPDDPCRIVTFCKSAQLGGTVLANIFTLGSLDMDPGDFLYVHPTEENARRWSKMKLAPMMKNTSAIARAFSAKARDAGDSITYKERADGRGAIQISGANSPASLSMITMQRQVQDDLAKWEPNSAGDPEKQADSRSRSHEFAKIFKNSTPLVMPGCRITKKFEAGTQEKFHVPCPHCEHRHVLTWENMLENLDEEHPERAHFSCPECGGVIEEHHRPAMIRAGEWIAENPKAAREHRSFYLWSAYSLLQSFERIAREWLDAKGDPAAEQTFLNDTVGRAYEAKGEAPPWEELSKRAEETGHRRGTIPAGYPVLTLGVDCQKDRVEWQAVAWGPDFKRAVIDHGVVDGHISEAAAQAGLTKILKTEWRNEAGRDIGVDMLAIDGNAWTEDVWSWVKRHPASKVMMVRGRHEEAAPLLQRVKKERNRRGDLLPYASRFYNFGASVLKMAFYRHLPKTDPVERGYVALPRGLEDEYFQEATAERRVPKKKDGFTVYRWVKDDTQDNEMLDTMMQAEAGAIRLGVRVFSDKRWEQLIAARDVPPPEVQLDLEDLPLVAASEPTEKAAPEKPKLTAKQRRRRKNRKPLIPNGGF